MKVKMILPALAEARSRDWRPIKYALFPPLGLASLAGYLADDDEIVIQDEHVETLDLSDEPDLVAIEVYVTSAYRSYELADHYRRKGAHVALGGLHVTSVPQEAALHADTVFIGPGEDTWPRFLADFRAGHPERLYRSSTRTLDGMPRVRRDLLKQHLYLAPTSIVVSRGCPHNCDFCYKEAFFKGGKSFYTATVDAALAEVESLPGRYVHFLDDNLFGDPRFAHDLFNGMAGMGKLWQAAGTVKAALDPELLEAAVASGLRTLFVGFETLSSSNLLAQNKLQNVNRDYDEAIRRMHDLGVMVNASFVFGMDDDDDSVFDRTVEWAIRMGIESATFHILTPYPGTALHERMSRDGRITDTDWDRYDTRHVVFRPAKMSPQTLQAGYRRAYRDFYKWSSILRSARVADTLAAQLRHVVYTGAWKKSDWLWKWVIRCNQVWRFTPVLAKLLEHSGGSSCPSPRALPKLSRGSEAPRGLCR